jgi:hypothetical protein
VGIEIEILQNLYKFVHALYLLCGRLLLQHTLEDAGRL